jgi:processive 1,2-diacylglycerol beta-glucosyltransferase
LFSTIKEKPLVNLYAQETGEQVGAINEAQFQFLVDQLEEESLEDRDYAITPMTVEFLAGQGADPELVNLLRQALGDRSEVNVRWSRV